MAKEEIFIPEMERLEIEPQKVLPPSHDENPFVTQRRVAPRVQPRRLAPACCACSKKSIKNTTSFKRSSNKFLKEPILKLEGRAALFATKPNMRRFTLQCNESPSRCPLQTLNLETLNVCPLVESDESSSLPLFSAPSFKELQPQSRESTAGPSGSSAGDRNRGSGPSCSQQALNPQCDITIDELASYFETLVHIPKKMSTMAEMMYI